MIIGKAINGKQLIKLLETKRPDIILLDIIMPELDGIETLKIVKKKYELIKIIMLSQFGERGLIKKCIELGADGYLLKDCGKQELIHSIKTVNAGGTWFEIRNIIHNLKKEVSISSPNLSIREMEVLQLICKEFTNREIAYKLKISKVSVNTYRTRLIQKAGAKKVIGLYHWALENKLINLYSL